MWVPITVVNCAVLCHTKFPVHGCQSIPPLHIGPCMLRLCSISHTYRWCVPKQDTRVSTKAITKTIPLRFRKPVTTCPTDVVRISVGSLWRWVCKSVCMVSYIYILRSNETAEKWHEYTLLFQRTDKPFNICSLSTSRCTKRIPLCCTSGI